MAWSETDPRRASRGGLVAVFVFVVLTSAAVAAFAVTRNVVSENEGRLLRERAGEVSAVLESSVQSSNATLAVLAVQATLPDRTAFELGAGAVARLGGGTVAAVRETDGRFVVASAGSGGLAPDQQVTGDRASLATRALQARSPVADLLREGPKTSLVFAVAAPAPARVVAMMDSAIDPSRPVPLSPGSPFSEMAGVLYASPQPDPDRVVLTSETKLPLTGRVVQVPFTLGAEQWTLVVKARSSLVGSFPSLAPWIILAAGVVAAVLTSAIVATLARRQEFANALVDDRTRELDTTHRFLERLLVSGPAVVVRAELSGSDRRISYVSPNVERILGLKQADVMREGSLVPYFHPDDAALGTITNAALLESGAQESNEFRLRNGDGSYRWVAAVAVPDIGEDGAPTGMFLYLTDISKRRAAEGALRAAQEAAEAANRSKSEFLSRMSHELRTPLNAVLGFGQLLKMQPLREEESDAVDQILRGGRHLLDLIDEVLDISRIEAGRLLLSPEAVLVSELVQESIDLVRSLAEQRQITLVADESGMAAYVFADRQRAKQVLLNLLSNAVKYNHVRGSVAVSCRELDPTTLRIAVGDTGPGIRSEQMDRLFAPFDRLDAGQTDIEGTGIGLALSKNLAEVMGGSLTVESTVGKGSTFAVDLPRVEGPVERYDRAQPEPATSIPAVVDESRTDIRLHKVLYIEDNPSNLRLIERILARRDDVEVVSAMQGRFGIELARQHQPTLILLDLHLPDISGEEILRRLREDPLTEAIPVVMVTADATAGQVQRLLSAGAAAYLTKPLDVARLLQVVDDLLAVG